MDVLHSLWAQAIAPHPAPAWMLLAALPCALAAILTPAWPYARNLITIAHEGGHAIVARAVGRRLAGIRLHGDTSGVTVSAGKPTGLGVILTVFAGYVAPSMWGLAAATALHHHRPAAVLIGFLTLLAVMFLFIRNLYGAFIVLASAATLWGTLKYTPVSAQVFLAYLITCFLLLAAPRPVWELHLKRRREGAPDSDADQLAHLTGIPGILWTAVFAATTLAAIAYGGALISGF